MPRGRMTQPMRSPWRAGSPSSCTCPLNTRAYSPRMQPTPLPLPLLLLPPPQPSNTARLTPWLPDWVLGAAAAAAAAAAAVGAAPPSSPPSRAAYSSVSSPPGMPEWYLTLAAPTARMGRRAAAPAAPAAAAATPSSKGTLSRATVKPMPACPPSLPPPPPAASSVEQPAGMRPTAPDSATAVHSSREGRVRGKRVTRPSPPTLTSTPHTELVATSLASRGSRGEGGSAVALASAAAAAAAAAAALLLLLCTLLAAVRE